MICLKCKHFIGLMINGKIMCEVLGDTMLMYYCRYYKPMEESKNE